MVDFMCGLKIERLYDIKNLSEFLLIILIYIINLCYLFLGVFGNEKFDLCLK